MVDGKYLPTPFVAGIIVVAFSDYMVAALSSCGNNCNVLHLHCTYHTCSHLPHTSDCCCRYWNPVCDVYNLSDCSIIVHAASPTSTCRWNNGQPPAVAIRLLYFTYHFGEDILTDKEDRCIADEL
jgi:hypothetical protein